MRAAGLALLTVSEPFVFPELAGGAGVHLVHGPRPTARYFEAMVVLDLPLMQNWPYRSVPAAVAVPEPERHRCAVVECGAVRPGRWFSRRA
jgi:hypothetical protein